MKYARFVFPLTVAIVLAACAGRMQTTSSALLPQTDDAQARAPSQQSLFVASASPYFVNAYALPLTNVSTPYASLNGMNEPVPLATGRHHLFVGSFSDSAVYCFALPLSPGAPPLRMRLDGMATMRSKNVLNAGDPSGLAVSPGFLYVAGLAPDFTSRIWAYSATIASEARPIAEIGGYGRFDFVSIATANTTLYAASAAQGTIRAFPLPLKTGETAAFTIHVPKQTNGAIGIAAWTSLYVTDAAAGAVLIYRLPYRSGEQPVKLDLHLADGQSPYGVAVDRRNLYVSAGQAVLQYPLPVRAGELPSANLPFDGFPAGVAVWPRWE